MFDPDDVDAIEGLALARQLHPILHGRGPVIQGAALADVVAMFFAGFEPVKREEAIKLWTACMRELIKANENVLLERYGPNPWDKVKHGTH